MGQVLAHVTCKYLLTVADEIKGQIDTFPMVLMRFTVYVGYRLYDVCSPMFSGLLCKAAYMWRGSNITITHMLKWRVKL